MHIGIVTLSSVLSHSANTHFDTKGVAVNTSNTARRSTDGRLRRLLSVGCNSTPHVTHDSMNRICRYRPPAPFLSTPTRGRAPLTWQNPCDMAKPL
eukprot:532696-Rhodomonas_salina.1